MDDSTYTLVGKVHVPPGSGFDMECDVSPPFVMDSYYGLRGLYSPLWLDHPKSPEIWMSRIQALELVQVSSLLRWNENRRDALLTFTKALTVRPMLPKPCLTFD